MRFHVNPTCRCVYELYFSLLSDDADFTYDMYTTSAGIAVGITMGLVAVDMNGKNKASREEVFPIALADKGIIFKCQDGEASVPKDKERILEQIGKEAGQLNATVHGVVAASVLEQVLKSDKDKEQYWQAVKEGNVRRLRIDLSAREEADTEANCTRAVEALGTKCDSLELTSGRLTELPGASHPLALSLNPSLRILHQSTDSFLKKLLPVCVHFTIFITDFNGCRTGYTRI